MEKQKGNNGQWSGLIWLSDLFRNYYEGQATEKQKRLVEEWNPEKEGAPDIRFLKKDEETERMWQAIAMQLGLKDAAAVAKGRSIAGALRKYAAAAVVLLALGAASYLMSTASEPSSIQSNTIAMDYYQSGAGERKQLLLPDGTVVYLNSDTKLGVAKILFNKEKREIWLDEGEAFFEVAKNPEKPFIVHTHNLETTVKGTSFNVKAYKELDESSVSVREGRVEVRNGASLLGTLTQDRQIIYNKTTGRFEEHQTSWEDAAAWMEGRLVMKQANSKELKLRLRQHFGVEVEIRGTALQGKLLSCSFQNGVSLKEVLDGVSLLYGIKYDSGNPDKVVLYQ